MEQGRRQRPRKGRLVLATVKGDVHDIGKNLVDIICTNNGYEVHNLGIKVSIADMVAKVKEVQADALGMSGLLVKSTLIIRDNLQELNALGLADIPVLLGGAALTRTLRGARPARGLRGPAVLRARRVRGAAHARQADGHQAQRREDAGVRPRCPAGRCRRGVRARGRCPSRLPCRSPDVVADNPVFAPAVPRRAGRQGPVARRHRRVHQRDRAVPQPVAVPARTPARRDDDSSRTASARSCAPSWPRPRPRACSCPRSSTATSRRTATATTSSCGPTSRAPPSWPASTTRASAAPRSCASPTSSARSSRGEVDYAAFHIVTMGAAVSEATAKLFADERVPGVPDAARHRRGDGRGAGRAVAPPDPHRVGLRRRGRPDARRPVPPAVPRRPLLVGLPGVPRPGGQRHGRPRSSAPTASASRSARRPAGSTSPSRPPRRSSATTRRPSTSSPGRPRAVQPRWLSASSDSGSPAMRVCHIRRGSVMSNGVPRCISRRLSQITASPTSHWWW